MTSEAAGPSDAAGTERPGVGVVFAAAKGTGAFSGPLMDGTGRWVVRQWRGLCAAQIARLTGATTEG